ncbi:pentatricopeptide repeat-containing protein At4g14820 [Aristolochia californica]|uniref:pentatricopeptide repeat-containing protein At4g14820 n=1 Tax=Aristolochia californica TaxID=171875 RepID=UPI0035E363A9
MAHLNQIHAQILRSGYAHPSLFSKLISSVTLSSSLDHALAIFHHVNPGISTVNQILKDLSRSKEPRKALLLYQRLRRDGMMMNKFSFPLLLKASGRVSGIEQGMEIHGVTVKMGLDSDEFVQTGLVGCYAACGRLGEAQLVFDKMPQRDLVAWSVMMDGYFHANLYNNVFLLFDEIKNSEIVPDAIIIATVISACCRSGNLNLGKEIHRYVLEKNLMIDPHLQAALINLYANCGSMDIAQKLYDEMPVKDLVASTAMLTGYSKLGKVDSARKIFEQMAEKDLVCWSAMISSYAESDHPHEALRLFNEMQVSGIKPDQVTMLSVISACAHLGALDQGKWVHIFVDRNGFNDVLSVNNALIDMYAKCGSLTVARSVFDNMPQRNVISWTSMITGLAMHGDGLSALSLFKQMKGERIEPNGVTFVGVLYACSHAGLIDEGRKIFASMINDHHITPKHEHYGCMVDLLGRANFLDEAVDLVKTMPFEPNVIIWGSLLGACRVHNNVELGKFAAKKLLHVDPHHDGAHVLLSNIYAKAGRWGDVKEVRRLMKNMGITKEKGCSWIEMKDGIHEFAMGDRSHPESNKIYNKLDEVVSELKLAGYAPDSGSVLVDLDEEEKKEVVLLHSEKLALAFGLLSVNKGSYIRIVKNLRVCEDCHNFMKLVSKAFEQEIVVRDRARFHHYRNGACSCKDYW